MIDLISFVIVLLCTYLLNLINYFVVLLCAYLVSKLVQSSLSDKSKQNINRLPPGPKQWPIVGNLFQLGQLPHRDMASFCEKYGPLVYLRLGNVWEKFTSNYLSIVIKSNRCFWSSKFTRETTGMLEIIHLLILKHCDGN